MVRIRVRIRLSIWLVSGFAHVFSVLIVTLPPNTNLGPLYRWWPNSITPTSCRLVACNIWTALLRKKGSQGILI